MDFIRKTARKPIPLGDNNRNILNEDNTILSSINLEELEKNFKDENGSSYDIDECSPELVTKTETSRLKRLPSSSNKNLGKKPKLYSSENATDTDKNLDKKPKHNASLWHDTFDGFEKIDFSQECSKKTNQKYCVIKSSDPKQIKDKVININESGVDILQDTLDFVNIQTPNVCNKTGKIVNKVEQKKKVEDKIEQRNAFDAFKAFLEEDDDIFDEKHVNRKLFSSQENKETVPKDVNKTKDGFTQFFKDSQVMNQINSVFDENIQETSQNNSIIEPETPEKGTSNVQKTENLKDSEEQCFKIPKLLSTYEKVIALNKSDTNLIHTKDIVTSEYRKEIDDLFEHVEKSICIMGTENSQNRLITDEILNVIFNDDNNPEISIDNKKSDKTTADLDWSDNTLEAGMNLSFGTSMRNSLLMNASKNVSISQITRGNQVISQPNTAFKSMGPFYDLPILVKNLIKQFKGIDELYDWQDECLKLPALKKKSNLIYALPTSGGKTLVAEILMLKEIMCFKKNVIFVLPYVAIVQEKVWSLSPFAVSLDFLVEEYASSKGNYPPRKRRRKNSVYIATIEKALGLLNSLIEHGRLHELGLVVVDELHLVGEEGRGATLEAFLTKLMFLKANVQVVGMSATIGNLEDIREFLNAEVYTKNFRPVELTEYVKCGTEIAKINWNHTNEEDLLVEIKKVDFKYSDSLLKLDPDMLGGLVSDIVPKKSCLIFCASKKNCENVAYLLCRTANPNMKEHMKQEKGQIIAGLKDESGELCKVLNISIKFGIAYHHSGLTSDERRIIEEGFRNGVICIICCTSTLAAGVNLPARRVILRSPYVGREFISLAKYKQMVGRAGRAGLGESGDSIVLTTPADLPKLKDLLLSPMNQALSGMHLDGGKGLRHLLLSCISLGLGNSRLELMEVTKKTLMSIQCDKLNVNIKSVTDNVIRFLFKLGAIEESSLITTTNSPAVNVSVQMESSTVDISQQSKRTKDGSSTSADGKRKKVIVLSNTTKFRVSKMGLAAIKGGLELSRAHLLYEDLFQAQNSLVLLDCLHLLYLVTPYETADQIRPDMQVYYDVLTRLGTNEIQTAKILGLNESVTVKMISGLPIKNVPERVVNRFFVTLMLYDLWNEKPVFQVSEKFQINRGIVQNLMTSAATFASNVVNFCQELEEFWAFSHLLQGMGQRLSHCCVKEIMPLMELPAVKQGRAKQLFRAGYKNLQSIAKATAEELMDNIEFLNKTVANQLIAASKMLLLERVENLREEAEDVLDGVDYPKNVMNTTVLK